MRHAIALLLALMATTAGADVVRILDAPREAVQARVDLIQQATEKVTLLYFLARDDRVTLGVLALLRDAKRRGVGDVRVIVDGAHLGDEGVEVRVYHPLNLRHPSWMFRRMHEKVIVADSARYITGGRNLGETYFGLASKKNYVDRDVYVDGASAADADRHFEDLWSSKHVAKLRVRVSGKEKQGAEKRLDDVLEGLARTGVIALDTGRDWSAGRKDAGAVAFLRDPADRLPDILEAAERSIVIESPYFIPSRSMRALLERKLAAGVQVLVVTNSLRSTDGLLPQAAYLKYRRRLVRAGVDFREYKGPDVLHAKSIVVDGRVTLIGSYNIDPRSQYLNTEVMCMSEDEEIARELLESVEAHIENAWTVHRAARGPSIRAWSPSAYGRRNCSCD